MESFAAGPLSHPTIFCLEGEPNPEAAQAVSRVSTEEAVEEEPRSARPEGGFEDIAVLAVRDTVLFPNALLPLSVGRPTSVALIESLGENRLIGVVSQVDPRTDTPAPGDLHDVGTIAMIHKIVRMREGQLIFCEGVSRMRVQEWTASEPFLRARVERLPEVEPEMTPELIALRQNVLGEFAQIVAAAPNLSDEVATAAGNIAEVGRLADFIAGTLPSLSHLDRQSVLEQSDARLRLQFINQQLAREVELLELRQKIQSQVQGQLSQSQREFYLREQLKAIQKELGEGEESEQETEELREKIEKAGMPEEVKQEALKELKRFARINPMSPEHNVARTYLEWLISLPWAVSSGEAVNVQRAAEILDEDHYDLEKVKNRILDYLAVMQLKPHIKGPILCFVGPPGVGKTSLGRSIARSLGRKFQRISMGGMHDEAEIRGHRRTYIGALPGQIMQALRRAGANDPVFVLDEVDKLGRDFRGDPASALLEVLDPQQNSTFRDNYLDVPFDLSHVLFITTANVLDTIPDALRDRMEIIELQGYTEQEKVMIAFRYLIPRQIAENGLGADGEGTQPRPLTFTDSAVRFIVRRYTREAGVRNLEREIGTVCRKVARRYAEHKEPVVEVTNAVVEEALGAPRFRPDTEVAERTRRPGVAVGLAWTPVGGDVLFIEAGRMPGGGRGLIMTGQLGSVMQESVQAALTWVRSNVKTFGIDPDLFRKSDIHVHVPAGAIPKDGPSAGVTMATALISMLTDRCVKRNLAMTGEITLVGQVLPIGGVKEKVLAARRSGVREVILPAENEVNVKEDLKAEQLNDMKIHYVHTMEEVAALALEPPKGRATPKAVAKKPTNLTKPKKLTKPTNLTRGSARNSGASPFGLPPPFRAASSADAKKMTAPPTFLYGTAWKEDRTTDLVRLALDAGFRGIDTANQRRHYFESAVGEAIRNFPRADLFLQTKYTYRPGQDERLPYDPAAPLSTQVAQSLASSLDHLHTDHVDSFVLHGPASGSGWTPFDAEVWSAMRAERDANRTRVLGVSNVSLRHLHEMEATESELPAYVQNRCFARTGWDRDIRAFCKAHAIVYQGFSLLTANPGVLRHPIVHAAAARQQATPAQIVFRFARGVGMLPLTGTSSPDHMRQDLSSENLTLSAEEIAALEALEG